MNARLSLAVVGCGYWGARHVRVAQGLPGARLALAVDPSEERLAHIRARYRGVPVARKFDTALRRDDIDAVVIATPISTHFALARRALEAGKHVLVEKPLATSSSECKSLIDLARDRNRVLMVGHTFEYHPAISFVREIVRRGDLGDIYYINSRRLNLGLYRPDGNVLWDLAPHDFSIIFSLLGDDHPLDSVGAWGFSHILPGVEDVVYAKMSFRSQIAAYVHVSWLDPVKVRQVTVVGSDGMLVFDDAQPSEKVRIYDKRFKPTVCGDSFAEFQSAYHYGDVRIPVIAETEPLELELRDFAAAIESGKEPRASGHSGLRVVTALEWASRSLRGEAVNGVPHILPDAPSVIGPLMSLSKDRHGVGAGYTQ